MELVAFVGTDRENWGQITGLINRGQWDKVVLVERKESEGFPAPEKGEEIRIDTSKPIAELTDNLKEKLSRVLGREFEVALSLASGNGKEHMALIGALLGVPVGIKLAVFTKNGVEFLS